MSYLHKDYMPGVQSYVNTGNETYQAVDILSNKLKIIDSDHEEVHEGRLYEIYAHTVISAGGTYDISINTPTEGNIHVRNSFIAASKGFILLEFYEDSSVVGGAPIIAYNHDRTSTNLSLGNQVTSATITAYGTLLKNSYIVGSTGVAGTFGGSSTTESVEWILKQNTSYTWHIINESSAENTVHFGAYGYDII